MLYKTVDSVVSPTLTLKRRGIQKYPKDAFRSGEPQKKTPTQQGNQRKIVQNVRGFKIGNFTVASVSSSPTYQLNTAIQSHMIDKSQLEQTEMIGFQFLLQEALPQKVA